MTPIAIDAKQPLLPPPPPANRRGDADAFANRLAEADEKASPATTAKQGEKPNGPPAEAGEQADAPVADVQGRESENQDDADQDEPQADASGEVVVAAAPAEPAQDVIEFSGETATAPAEGVSEEALPEPSADAAAQDSKNPGPETEVPAEVAAVQATPTQHQQPTGEEEQAEQAHDAPEVDAGATEEEPDERRPAAGADAAKELPVAPAEELPQAEPVEAAAGTAVTVDKAASEKEAPQATQPPPSKSEDAPTATEQLEEQETDQQPSGRETALRPLRDADQPGPAAPVTAEVSPQPTDAEPPEPQPAADTAPASEKSSEPAAPQQSQHSSLERLTSSRYGVTRAAEPPPAASEPEVDPARFVGRVSRAFDAASQRGGEVRVRLSPPELGAMQIKLSVSVDGAMHASVETETAAARNVLLDNLPALRERLAEMQIRVEKFDVDVQHDGAGQQDWTENERRRDDHRARQANTLPGAGGKTARAEPDASPSTDPGAASSGPDQINLVA